MRRNIFAAHPARRGVRMPEEQTAKPRSRHGVVRLRTAVILFFSLILVLSEAGIWFYYRQSIQAAREEAGRHIEAAGDKVLLSARLLTKPLSSLCDAAPALPGADVEPVGFAHPLLGYLLTFLDTHPETYSLYFGYGDGDYFQTILLRDRPKAAQELHAPAAARYALRSITTQDGARVERWRFLDRDRRPLGSTAPRPAAYDPRTRPWYQTARRADGTIKTDLYVFSSTGAPGLTMARDIPGPAQAVFGLDLTLDTLSSFLRQAKIGASGLAFLFDAEGRLVAYPDADKVARAAKTRGGSPTALRAEVRDLEDPMPGAVYQAFVQNGGEALSTRRLVVDGKAYLASVRPMQELSARGDYMALVAREADFMVTAQRIRSQALLFGLGLLALGTPLLLLISANITRTLARLTEEAERISRLEMDSTEVICSHIDEVDRLGDAVSHMRAALLSSCRYLPQSLVRQFIKSGRVPCLGGERRDITLLFTDVQNFTTLSEGMPPEDLMAAMSEYFEIVGQAILKSGGTIDKFIGDSVMAFWNAPLATENHVEDACQAALRLSLASQELNARREAVGGPVMRTRIGIHTGTAIVGNVGASDRMNYTALGPVVNLASRLEGLNKYYATRILVSHDVRDKAHRNFLFRSVDVVVPKGVKEPLPIFELVGAMPLSPYPDVAVPRARLGFCSRWERAMALYRTVQWEKALEEFQALHEAAPDDFVAAMYLQRVRRLLANKPGKDWKAVQKFMHK
jgi:adenylate cyclase